MERAVTKIRKWGYSYPATIKVLEECGGEDGINCVSCEYKGDCKYIFDEQVRLRNTGSWKLKTRKSDHANAQGSGLPDKSGGWIPTLTLRNFRDTIFRG